MLPSVKVVERTPEPVMEESDKGMTVSDEALPKRIPIPETLVDVRLFSSARRLFLQFLECLFVLIFRALCSFATRIRSSGWNSYVVEVLATSD